MVLRLHHYESYMRVGFTLGEAFAIASLFIRVRRSSVAAVELGIFCRSRADGIKDICAS